MRILLSTIGSRGDVQPLLALACALRALGVEARFCVPPDFRDWIEGFGFAVVPIGPELRGTASATAPSLAEITPAQRQAMMDATVATQFATIPAAADGCDLIVAAGALQLAARSIAQWMRIPYVFAAYCPLTLPSACHAPIALPGRRAADATAGPLALWASDAEQWNANWAAALNTHRSVLGLGAVTDVRDHLFAEQPWLAADACLGPWPGASALAVAQTGAWILPDRRPLPLEIEAFLDAGEAPIYFGFGSIRAPQGIGRAMIESARALGRRALVSRGWAGLSPMDDGRDLLSIGEVNQQALFARVAAVVHHGGAGTTTAAAMAGAPQVVIPQHYDQPYWSQRVERLGIGVAHAQGTATASSLTPALGDALRSDVAARAREISASISGHGAAVAARALTALGAQA